VQHKEKEGSDLGMNQIFVIYEIMWGIVCLWLVWFIVRVVLSKENDQ
jgi:heme/copper-type cytochrome/quinol oxidase subunit 2